MNNLRINQIKSHKKVEKNWMKQWNKKDHQQNIQNRIREKRNQINESKSIH